MSQIQAHLDRLAALDGVQGAFLFDYQGTINGYSTPINLASDQRRVLARILAQSMTDLTTSRISNSMDIDLFFSEGRLVIKGISQQRLCIVCDRQVNNSLLNISLVECINTLRGMVTTPVDEKFASMLSGLKRIAEEILGEHAPKVINILENAQADGEGLLDSIGQAEKVTRLFIDKDLAGPMAQQMRDLVERS